MAERMLSSTSLLSESFRETVIQTITPSTTINPAMRERLKAEVEAIELQPQTRELIDVERLQNLVDNWPTDGWDREDVIADYRLSLLRAVSVANFVRRASGANF